MTEVDPAKLRELMLTALLLLTVSLRWMQPAGSAPVDRFRVYQGARVGTSDWLLYEGLPTPDPSGVYEATVRAGRNVWVWIRAVNAGGESTPSNALFFGSSSHRPTRRHR